MSRGSPSVVPARKMSGEDAREDVTQSQQIVHQVRIELEEVLQLLKR